MLNANQLDTESPSGMAAASKPWQNGTKEPDLQDIFYEVHPKNKGWLMRKSMKHSNKWAMVFCEITDGRFLSAKPTLLKVCSFVSVFFLGPGALASSDLHSTIALLTIIFVEISRDQELRDTQVQFPRDHAQIRLRYSAKSRCTKATSPKSRLTGLQVRAWRIC